MKLEKYLIQSFQKETNESQRNKGDFIMYNPDLKEMIKDCNSRYSLVVGVAKRAREIRDEAIAREEHIDVKTVSTAIEEISEGKYVIDEPAELKNK